MMFDFLRKVPLFADLPEADLRHLCGMVAEVRLTPGEELFSEGSPGDRAYVVTDGQLEIVKASSGREVLLTMAAPGKVIGELALLVQQPRMASVRARTDATLVAIDKDHFNHLLQTSVSAARVMFNTIVQHWRQTESALRQSEKMAQLGTLSAGVAHELNNPAAAVKRGSDQLRTAIADLESAQTALSSLTLSDKQQQTLAECAVRAQEHAVRPPELDALARSDREAELENWLETYEVENAWDLAPDLVNLNYDITELEALAEGFGSGQMAHIIPWLHATYNVHNLLSEIGQGAERISGIVKALKSYSYLDQAPVQTVDLHEGLENTLLILRHKLKSGISVRREYAPDLPSISGYGSELNQVWTNVIDNAADALDGRGQITLRTRREGDWVVVEVEDNGPGIPPEIQSRLFDPFFTTKPPGQGTGLGLDISYGIVVHKHQGDIRVISEPGRTCFQIWLPEQIKAD
jgi:signal transduction histidine kinase